MKAIETRNLTKRFGRTTAVRDLNLSIPTGAVFGFLGRNGAGKTTTIRMLMGHLHPGKGDVSVLGSCPWTHRAETLQRIAYVSDRMSLPGWMTASKLIAMGEGLFPRWDSSLAVKLLSDFGLPRNGRFRDLSLGQQRKTLILSALCQSADLLILDEPTVGLDVESRHQFLERILDIACQEGRTVFLSSHLLSDVERVVDQIGVIRNGSMVYQGDMEELKSSVRRLQITEQVEASVLSEHFTVVSCDITSQGTDATVTQFTDQALAQFAARLQHADAVHCHGFNLEELYLQLSGPVPSATQSVAVTEHESRVVP